MSLWTDIRDTVESGAVAVGNYVLPGSGLITKNLVSEGAQNQLNSSLGQLAMLGGGVAGANAGNLANYGTAYDKVAGLFGGNSSAGITGQQAVDAYNAGKISAAEFEALATGAGTTSKDLLSGAAYDKVANLFGGENITGQQAVDAFNSGKISAAEFEALATGAGTTSKDLLSGAGTTFKDLLSGAGTAGLSKYLTPAAILASGIFGAQAAQKAATTQAEAQGQANQLAYAMYKEQQALREPWRQAGLRALPKFEQIANEYKPFTPSQMYQDPGYAFRLAEGQKALEQSAAARGGLLSGTTGKNLLRYGQEMGSQEYNAARNRYIQDYQNRLAAQQTLAGYGTGATSALTGAAGQYGQQAGAGITNIGAAQAAGQVGAANALTGALGTGLNYMGNQDLINALTRRSAYTQA